METLNKIWGWFKWLIGGLLVIGAAILFIPRVPVRRRKLTKELRKLNNEQKELLDDHVKKVSEIEDSEKKALSRVSADLTEELNEIKAEKDRIKTEANKGPVALAKEWADFMEGS